MQTTLAGEEKLPENKIVSFEDACRRVGNEVLSWNDLLVCHHYDADGLSSGGIVANALRRAKKRFECLSLKNITEETVGNAVAVARAKSFSAILFVDLGAGQISVVEKLVYPFFKVAVIDHHIPQAESSVLHANCELHGHSGSTDACSASTAFYCFRDAEWTDGFGQTRDNWDLAELAVVGCVGDMQDAGGLVSLNKKFVDEAVDRGLIEKRKDLRMFGRVSRTLVNFLSYASEPVLPGLTGNDKACAAFLEDNGIPFKDGDNWLHYNDLDGNDRRKFVGALVNHCLEKKLEEEVVFGMVGDVYLFPREPANTELSDAYEFSTLLNACGRHGSEKLGISVCLKELNAFEEARKVLTTHRAMISKGISFAKSHCNDYGAFYLVDGRGSIEETVVGTVIGGFFNSGVLHRSKPILGFSLDEKSNTKASGRGSKQLVEKGLDLNLVMRLAAENVGGLGGGHKVAAGATIPAGRESDFLKKAKEIVEKQTSRA